jgi:hypothetical protein
MAALVRAMKYSLTLRNRRALNRSEAKACLAANLALPGAGSLAAGRAIGYVQMAVAFAGLIISLLTGIPMIEWSLANWARTSDPMSDSGEFLLELWTHVRWPIAGIGLFVIGIIWAGATGLQLLAQAPREGVPPIINPE